MVVMIVMVSLVCGGCAASRSRHYNAHLRNTLDATETAVVDQELALAFGLTGTDDTAIASADPDAAWGDGR